MNFITKALRRSLASTMRTLLFLLLLKYVEPKGILYPRDSETRTSISLNGIWEFLQSDSLIPPRGLRASGIPTEPMPVPSSFNDLSTNWTSRDFVGVSWYERNFFVPKSWYGQRVWIRFGSTCQNAEVWVNGESVVKHETGHLPFEAEVTNIVKIGNENTVFVAVDNTLTQTSIPQGDFKNLSSGRYVNTYTFDFFNYGGIDRPVKMYTTPNTYIDDVTVTTEVDEIDGKVNYQISIIGTDEVTTKVTVVDQDGNEINSNEGATGTIDVPNAKLWWPYLMDPDPGYQYKLQIELFSVSGLVDKYVQPFGIRSLEWNSTQFLINGRPIYIRGFGRHEDSDVRGKGLDLALVLRDYNLIKWIGANAYRTSHYPYAEEIMDLADQMGIMVIDECPAVNTEHFSDELLANHQQSLTELIQRDKNRPAVVIWSVANEPRTQYNVSEDYYRQVVEHSKTLDKSRPVTLATNQIPENDYAAQFLDIASFNLYKAWYEDPGSLDVIIPGVVDLVHRWRKIHNIPVLITEYGADTVEGFHQLPVHVWSEEFQNAIFSNHFQAFDQLRAEGYFIGEMIWNFADFKTAQSSGRVGGNRKGIFTRERQPKSSAVLLRKRYWNLAHHLDGFDLPDDLYEYVIGKDEL